MIADAVLGSGKTRPYHERRAAALIHETVQRADKDSHDEWYFGKTYTKISG
jgi:hypothetical protein